MKVLGIDYGAKRIGLAVSDQSGGFAFPLEVIPTDGALSYIEALTKKDSIAEIAMGDTRSYGDVANPVTSEAERFADALRKATGLAVALVFEAGSSREASRFAPERKQHDDASAAAVILQRYLDTKK
jgi:putative Holliday junction resolvase